MHAYIRVYIYILAYIPTYLPTDRPTYLPTYWGELGQPAKNAIFAGFTIPAPMCCSSGNSELHFFHTGAPYADRMGLKKSPKAKAMIPKLKYLRRFWVLRAMVMRSHWTYIYTYIHAYIHTCLHAYRHAYMFLWPWMHQTWQRYEKHPPIKSAHGIKACRPSYELLPKARRKGIFWASALRCWLLR